MFSNAPIIPCLPDPRPRPALHPAHSPARSCPSLRRLRLNGCCALNGVDYNPTPAALPPPLEEGAPPPPPPAFPLLVACGVAAKSNPEMPGLGTGATNMSDGYLARCSCGGSSALQYTLQYRVVQRSDVVMWYGAGAA